ncbi:unnamed protein product, partial [Ascophyllum nodosum]
EGLQKEIIAHATFRTSPVASHSFKKINLYRMTTSSDASWNGHVPSGAKGDTVPFAATCTGSSFIPSSPHTPSDEISQLPSHNVRRSAATPSQHRRVDEIHPEETSQSVSEGKLHVQVLSAFLYLACTNFLAKSMVGILPLRMLQDTLVKALEQTNVDIVDFVACHFAYTCSYHQGNQFFSFLVRVFKPPTKR